MNIVHISSLFPKAPRQHRTSHYQADSPWNKSFLMLDTIVGARFASALFYFLFAGVFFFLGVAFFFFYFFCFFTSEGPASSSVAFFLQVWLQQLQLVHMKGSYASMKCISFQKKSYLLFLFIPLSPSSPTSASLQVFCEMA